MIHGSIVEYLQALLSDDKLRIIRNIAQMIENESSNTLFFHNSSNQLTLFTNDVKNGRDMLQKRKLL